MHKGRDSTYRSERHVVVVGCGGNIGSHLVPHLGRMPEVGHLTLVDRDVYERDNLYTQDIHVSDIDKPKSAVQARRLRRIRPELRAHAIADAIEHVPLGRLKGDLMVAGLDSRLARQVVNQKAWMMGTTLIDAGVDGPGLLARVSTYFPGPGGACHECSWQAADYETIEQVYPCTAKDGGLHDVEAPPTNAPSSLGALAASLAALECRRVLEGSTHAGSRRGREVVLEAAHGNLYVTALEANSQCRMPGHRERPLVVADTCPGTTPLGDVVAAHGHLRVIGQSFVTHLTCPQCGGRRERLALRVSLRRAGQRRCKKCGVDMVATGFDTRDELEADTLPRRALGRSLYSIGLRDGDWLAVGGNGYVGDAHVVEVRKERREPAPSRRQE